MREPVTEAKADPAPRWPPWRARELVRTAILALVVFVGVRTVLQPYAVEGSSMDPGLHDGQRLFVSRALYLHLDTTRLWNLLPGEDRPGRNVVFPFATPERGEVIVFDPPTPAAEPYIKRIIALPGETVSIRDGTVFVEGAPLPEPYLAPLGDVPTACAGRWCDITVPENSVYVLGDNRHPLQSVDSRTFGPVSVDRIIGQAIFRTWPPEEFGPIPDAKTDAKPAV